MANLQCTVWILFCGFFGASVQAGVSITGCNGVKDTTRYADVNLQHADHSFTCVNIPAQSTVLWKLDDHDAGTCPPVTSSGQDSCDTAESNVIEALIPRRTSPVESVVTIIPSKTRMLENAQLHCLEEGSTEGSFSSRDTCTVNLIRPAQGKCEARFMTSSVPWTVHVECRITSGSSSLGVYRCRLNQIMKDQSSKQLEGWRDMEQNTLPTGSAVCRFNVLFDALVQGPQHYTVQLLPGLQMVNVTFSGSNTISQPDRPSKVCTPPKLVPEHGNLTCRCSTENIGQPPGWLRWSRSHGSGGFDTVLAQGGTGSKELEFVTTLSRQDHNITEFRCDAVWAKTIKGRVKVATVGYPASQVRFNIMQAQPVDEDTKVTFSCSATDGRPAPTLTLKTADGRVMASKESSLSHHSVVHCESSGDYTCTASNGMGPDKMQTAYLNVTCAPRDIQTEAIQPVSYQGEETGFTFELVANPTPDSVSFVFLGSQETNPSSKVKDIAMVGHCRPKTGVLYISSCSVIVNNVTSSAAAGLYRGRIQNQRGSVDFVFEVKVDAMMPNTSSGGQTGIVVAAAVVGVLVIIAVIVIAIVIYRRRKGTELTHESDESPVNNAGPVYGNMNVQDEAANRQDAGSAAPTDANRGREVNQDGSLYMNEDSFLYMNSPASHPVPAATGDDELYTEVV